MAADGSIVSELSRRLGCARADTLARVWSHSTLSTQRKLQIFEDCVQTKLLYGLHAAWLRKHELAKLDSFHVRCLRKVLRIPHSYISRISNAVVLDRARRPPLSRILLHRQLCLFVQIARQPVDHPVRRAVFQPSSSELRPPAGRRPRGRPRQSWTNEL